MDIIERKDWSNTNGQGHLDNEGSLRGMRVANAGGNLDDTENGTLVDREEHNEKDGTKYKG